MNKTLRIVAKDIRHLWIEILVSLLLTAGFAVTEHFGWPQMRHEPFYEAGTLRIWMQVLMPISWWLLISRAVHDESLVGDRQFWITRPYGWPRVLSAKLIFITLFTLVPYFLAQCFLLHQADLHPLAVLPGLVLTLAYVFGFFILPLLALSTVTATITRMFVIYFAIAVYAGLATYFISIIGKSPEWTPGSEPPYMAIALWLIPLITAAVTLLQYARRQTAFSVALLLVLGVALTVGAAAMHYAKPHLSDFPKLAANETSPVTIALDPDPRLQHPLAVDPEIQRQWDMNNSNDIQIPIIISGIAPNHAVDLTGKIVTISAPGMQSRTIPWNGNNLYRPSLFVSLFNPGPLLSSASGSIDIPAWIHHEFAGKMVTLHITYAVTEFESEPAVSVPFDGREGDIPQNGHCSVDDPKNNGADCRYALAEPDLTYVTWNLRQSCSAASPNGPTLGGWVGSTNHGVRELNPSPVILSHLFIITSEKDIGHHIPNLYTFCPGSALTFTKYHIVRRRLVEVTLPPLDPRIYVRPPSHPESAVEPNMPTVVPDSE